MASVVAFAEPRSSFRPRARARSHLHLLHLLLDPALLLGIWRVWSSAAAPRLGVYFTAEALLVAYAYFAVVRQVNLHARSHDSAGQYRRELALQAAQDFVLALRLYWVRIAIAVLSLLVAALMLDVLTAGTGIQHRPNVHLSILFVEMMVWARYGAAIVIASAQWLPPQPAAFAAAREQADSIPVARSFALTNIAFGVAALVAIAGYKFGGPLLPTAKAELVCSAGVYTGLALLALWLQCRWARGVLPRLEARPAPSCTRPSET